MAADAARATAARRARRLTPPSFFQKYSGESEGRGRAPAQVQSRTTLPDSPDFIAAKPASKSSFPERCVLLRSYAELEQRLDMLAA